MAGLAEQFKIFLVVVTSPYAVLPFAGDDVVDLDGLGELLAVGALVVGAFAFEYAFGVCPSVVVADRVRALTGTPSGLATRQFLAAQFAVPLLSWNFEGAIHQAGVAQPLGHGRSPTQMAALSKKP